MPQLKVLDRLGPGRTAICPAIANLATPAYFPSVSSTCSTDSPARLIQLLIECRYPRALVSAFDCGRRIHGGLDRAGELLAELRSAGCVVLLDSGAFECQVLDISDWSPGQYEAILQRIPVDAAMTFDAARGHSNAKSPVEKSSGPRKPREVPGAEILVVHGRDRASILENLDIALVDFDGAGVAVPDRECGPNLLSRTRTIAEIRQHINSKSEEFILHILGCGSPPIMAAFAMAGADSFDSLDWAQGTIDVRTLEFVDPILRSATGCGCQVCSTLKGPDGQLALLHNLLFYQEFGGQLRAMIRDGTVSDFLQAFLGAEVARTLEKAAAGPFRDW